MASPLLPYLTLRIRGLPTHKAKTDIKTLFDPDDSERILYTSIARDVLSSSLSTRIATVTFSCESPTLQALLEKGKVFDKHDDCHLTYTVDRMFYGFTPFNDPKSTEKSAE